MRSEDKSTLSMEDGRIRKNKFEGTSADDREIRVRSQRQSFSPSHHGE
jgi:hypothetical protein